MWGGCKKNRHDFYEVVDTTPPVIFCSRCGMVKRLLPDGGE